MFSVIENNIRPWVQSQQRYAKRHIDCSYAKYVNSKNELELIKEAYRNLLTNANCILPSVFDFKESHQRFLDRISIVSEGGSQS